MRLFGCFSTTVLVKNVGSTRQSLQSLIPGEKKSELLVKFKVVNFCPWINDIYQKKPRDSIMTISNLQEMNYKTWITKVSYVFQWNIDFFTHNNDFTQIYSSIPEHWFGML